MFVMNWALLVEAIPVFAPLALIELKNLQHNKFVAQSQALSVLVQGASLFVNDMEQNLTGVEAGSGTAADVISATVSSIKALYPSAIEKLGLDADQTTALIHMILQKLPLSTDSKNIVSQFTGAVTEAPIPARTVALMRHAELTGLKFPRRIL